MLVKSSIGLRGWFCGNHPIGVLWLLPGRQGPPKKTRIIADLHSELLPLISLFGGGKFVFFLGNERKNDAVNN